MRFITNFRFGTNIEEGHLQKFLFNNKKILCGVLLE